MIAAGKLRLDASRVDLAPSSARRSTPSRPPPRRRGVALHWHCDAASCGRSATRTGCSRSLHNLLVERGEVHAGGRPRRCCGVERRGRRRRASRVEDTGIGIDAGVPAARVRALRAGRRAARRAPTAGSGSGSRSCATSSSSTAAPSRPRARRRGRGATFTVRLPAVRRDPEPGASAGDDARCAPLAGAARPLRRRRCRDAADRRRCALEQHGAIVAPSPPCATRWSAWTIPARAPPERHRLPEEDGYELIRRLRSRGREHSRPSR